MKFRTPAELAIICTTGLIALTLVLFGLHNADANGKSIVFVVIALSIGAGLIALARSLTTRKRAQLELTGGEQYRALAEEYRRLADLAITGSGTHRPQARGRQRSTRPLARAERVPAEDPQGSRVGPALHQGGVYRGRAWSSCRPMTFSSASRSWLSDPGAAVNTRRACPEPPSRRVWQ